MAGPYLLPDAPESVKPIPAVEALYQLQRAVEDAVMWHANPYSASRKFCRKELHEALAKASVLIDLLVAS